MYLFFIQLHFCARAGCFGVYKSAVVLKKTGRYTDSVVSLILGSSRRFSARQLLTYLFDLDLNKEYQEGTLVLVA